MPSASNKTEQKASKEVETPICQVINAVEKKVRNLEKRKGKLDTYKERQDQGEILNKDQEDAVGKYEVVMQNLRFAKELQEQFVQMSLDIEKMARKQKKRDLLERQMVEQRRVNELLLIQNILDSMGTDTARNDFLAGNNGACELTQANMEQLDELYKLISPSRDQDEDYSELRVAASQHIVDLLDGKDKAVLETTYKALKEVFNNINASGYFDRQQTEPDEEEQEPGLVEAETSESGHSDQEFVVVKPEEVPEHTSAEVLSSLPPDVPEPVQHQSPPDTQQTQHQVMEAHEQPPRPADTRLINPQVPQMGNPAAPEDAFFATGTAEYMRSRPFNEIVSSVQGNFNFLQDSEIDVESPHMDPAVVVAQPMPPHMTHPSQQRTETTTGYSSQTYTAEQQQPTQQQQQQQTTTQQQQQTQQQHDYSGLTQTDSSTYNPQQAQTYDNTYSSNTNTTTGYSQILSQNLPQQPVSLHSNVVEEQSLASQMGHTSIGGTAHGHVATTAHGHGSSPAMGASVPSSIPMPSQSYQSQTTPIDQQAQQQQQQAEEKKSFQMNVQAPVFQSMYSASGTDSSSNQAAQQAGGDPGSFTTETGNFSSQDAAKFTTETGTFSVESSKYDMSGASQPSQPPQPSTEFPETGTFGSSSSNDTGNYGRSGDNNFSRGGRGGGFRGGSRGGRGNMSNGFSRPSGNREGGYQNRGTSRRGGDNSNYSNGRGGSRGNYQGYPPRTDYRPEGGYQGFNNTYNKQQTFNNNRGSSMPRGGGRGGSGGRGGPSGGRGNFSNSSGRGSFSQKAAAGGGGFGNQQANPQASQQASQQAA